MSTVVNIDQKGRVIIPKSFREKANIKAPGKLLIVPKEKGCIELVQIEDDLKRAKQIASNLTFVPCTTIYILSLQ